METKSVGMFLEQRTRTETREKVKNPIAKGSQTVSKPKQKGPKTHNGSIHRNYHLKYQLK